MKRPQRPMRALAGTYERKAHEGRLIELEATGTVITQERLEALAALGFRESPPIQPFDGDLDSVEHLLHGFSDAFPAIAAAQDRMSLDNSLPRAKEGSFLQRLAQRRHHLLEVDAAIHSADRVEQHPRLRRRQFIGIDHTRHSASLPILWAKNFVRAERGAAAAEPARRLPLSTTIAPTKPGAGAKLSTCQPQQSPGVFSTRRILAGSPGASETSKRSSGW